MMKKIISLVFTIFLSFFLISPAFADEEVNYIRDDVGFITTEEDQKLEEQAAAIAKEFDFQPYFLVTEFVEEELEYYADRIYQTNAGDVDGVILVLDNLDKVWHITYGGKGKERLSDDSETLLWGAFNSEDTWYGAISNYLTAIRSQFQPQLRLVDEADLLSSDEEKTLLAKLDEISERQKCDVAVLTVDGLGGKTPEAFTDDYFDYNGYGQGDNHDGLLLMVSMEERDWHITTTGYAIEAFTDKGIEYLSKKFLSDLSKGNYAEAFTIFADQSDAFITQARTGEPFDVGNLPKEPLSWIWLPISAGLGVVVAFISVSAMSSKLKTVRHESAASHYIKKDSLELTRTRDSFLYRNVNRRLKPKPSSSSGGGSSSHSSSSGRSHGGGGGKF